MKKRAFTLVELLVVIVIIGILFALSVPAFQENQAQDQAVEATEDILDILDEVRINMLTNKECPLGNAWTLFFVDSYIAIGCDYPDESDLPSYDVVRYVDISEYTRLDIKMFADLREVLGDQSGLLEVGSYDDNYFGEDVNIIHEFNDFDGAYEYYSSEESEGIKIDIRIDGSEYERTICYNARTWLTTVNNGTECLEPISPFSG